MHNGVALFNAHGDPLPVRQPDTLITCTLGATNNLVERLRCRWQFPKTGRYWAVWSCGVVEGCAGFCRITVRENRRRGIVYDKHFVTDPGFDLWMLLLRYGEHTVMSPGLSNALATQIKDILEPSLDCVCIRGQA